MIDLYTFSTPNGRKVSIMLEELGMAYRVHAIDIGKGDQFSPEYVAINPNSRIPAIIDEEGPGGEPITLFESGAILIYLAEKAGSPLFPTEARARYSVIQWLMFQMGGIGPMFGQANHFIKFAREDIPYARERYKGETLRLYGVLDKRLAKTDYLAGKNYSIADIATFPWVDRFGYHEVELESFPHVKKWHDGIAGRTAVKKGMSLDSK